MKIVDFKDLIGKRFLYREKHYSITSDSHGNTQINIWERIETDNTIEVDVRYGSVKEVSPSGKYIKIHSLDSDGYDKWQPVKIIIVLEVLD